MNIQTPDAHLFRFGMFELDTQSGELRRHGLKVRLPDQSFQILKTLIGRPGEVVTRDELRRVLWTAETFVDFEVGLNSAVRKLREALDDSAENPRFVRPCRAAGIVSWRRSMRLPRRPLCPKRRPPRARNRCVREVAGGHFLTGLCARAHLGRALPRSRLALSLACCSLPSSRWRVCTNVENWFDQRAGPAEEPIRSLVVLPFANLTGDAAQDYFVDAVTDAVTGHLAQVDGLDVISRTSARQYKETAKGVREIGSELKVDGIVEGAVVRTESGVRITAKLIRAATERHIWAQAYESEVGYMIPLQQRIASDLSIAAGRPARPPAGGRAMQGIDAQAYDAYVKGLTARACRDMNRSAGPLHISSRRLRSSRTSVRHTPSWRWHRCNSCSLVPSRPVKRFPRRRRPRARRCNSMKRFHGRTWRSARS